LEYPSVVPSVDLMTDAQSPSALAYDDPATPSELSADCRAAEERLSLSTSFDSVARAAARPAPSIRFEDFPREVTKPEIHPATAARRIAAALDLDLD
jgi:hypothetical protein